MVHDDAEALVVQAVIGGNDSVAPVVDGVLHRVFLSLLCLGCVVRWVDLFSIHSWIASVLFFFLFVTLLFYYVPTLSSSWSSQYCMIEISSSSVMFIDTSTIPSRNSSILSFGISNLELGENDGKREREMEEKRKTTCNGQATSHRHLSISCTSQIMNVYWNDWWYFCVAYLWIELS